MQMGSQSLHADAHAPHPHAMRWRTFLQSRARRQAYAPCCPATAHAQVYACVAALGCDPALCPPQQRLGLLAVCAHAARRQGEVWGEVASQLAEEGVEPTEEDRCPGAPGVAVAVVVWLG